LLRIALGGALIAAVNSIPLRMFVDRNWAIHVVGVPVAIPSATTYVTPARKPLPQLDWMGSMEAFSALLSSLPPGLSVAASEHGILGARFIDTTVIDLVGLHDKVIAHEGFKPGYVVGRKPDLIWFPHNDYTGEVSALVDDAGFQQAYEFYPGVFDYGLAVRKASPYHEAIQRTLEDVFARTYPGLRAADHLGQPVRSASPH
jgi:hypothetical protein